MPACCQGLPQWLAEYVSCDYWQGPQQWLAEYEGCDQIACDHWQGPLQWLSEYVGCDQMEEYPWQQADTLMFLSEHPLSIYRRDVWLILLSSCWQLTRRQVSWALVTKESYSLTACWQLANCQPDHWFWHATGNLFLSCYIFLSVYFYFVCVTACCQGHPQWLAEYVGCDYWQGPLQWLSEYVGCDQKGCDYWQGPTSVTLGVWGVWPDSFLPLTGTSTVTLGVCRVWPDSNVSLTAEWHFVVFISTSFNHLSSGWLSSVFLLATGKETGELSSCWLTSSVMWWRGGKEKGWE